MAEVHVLEHPLIQHKLAILRNKETSVKEFLVRTPVAVTKIVWGSQKREIAMSGCCWWRQHRASPEDRSAINLLP